MGLLPDVSGHDHSTLTQHAMLVPWGLFARQIDLVQRIQAVPIPQRTREHAPQSKLLEFFVATLSGCAYLQDISAGPVPLDQDAAVAQAWGQPYAEGLYVRDGGNSGDHAEQGQSPLH